MAKQTAYSKLCLQLSGEIIKWLDDNQFIVRIGCREIVGNKQYWRVEDGDC